MGDLRSGCPQQPGGTHPRLTSNRRRPDSTVALSEPRDHKFLPQMLHKLPKREECFPSSTTGTNTFSVTVYLFPSTTSPRPQASGKLRSPRAERSSVPSGLRQRGLLGAVEAQDEHLARQLRCVLIAPSQEQAELPRELPLFTLTQGPTGQTGLSKPGCGS